MMNKDSKIYVAGHNGMVGSAICRRLQNEGYSNILVRDKSDLDLTNDSTVLEFFQKEKPEYVFMAAAKVGGIIANRDHPAEFFYENMRMELNIIHASYLSGVKKFMFFGSTCVYPKLAEQPLMEDALLSGPLEPTNEGYAVAKISGIKMCQFYAKQYGVNFVSVMPTSLYGPNDNFDPEHSHVIPAMIRKFHEAKVNGNSSVTLWGTGTPKREFMHVDDLADAAVFLMNVYDNSDLINIGIGDDFPIKELAEKICKVVEFKGDILFDTTKPDGTPRKLVYTKKLQDLGWSPKINLDTGLNEAYFWFLKNLHRLNKNENK